MNKLLLNFIIWYVITSYVFWIGLVIFAVGQMKKQGSFTGNIKKDYKELLPLTLGLAFSPLTLPMFLFNLIKETIQNQ